METSNAPESGDKLTEWDQNIADKAAARFEAAVATRTSFMLATKDGPVDAGDRGSNLLVGGYTAKELADLICGIMKTSADVRIKVAHQMLAWHLDVDAAMLKKVAGGLQ